MSHNFCVPSLILGRRMAKKEYLLYSARGGRNCAVRFLNAKTGEYLPAISLGTQNKKDAEKTVIQWLKNGIPNKGQLIEIEKLDYILMTIKSKEFDVNAADKILTALKARGFVRQDVEIRDDSTPLLSDYVLDFWNIETSKYVKERLSTGKTIGTTHCKNMLYAFKKHALPIFGDMRLSELNIDIINDFLFTCEDKGLSSSTINDIGQSICQPLKYAFVKKIINQDISIGLFKFSKPAKERGILTYEEADRLFSVKWKSKRAYAASILASQTGMRLGEIIALRKNDIGLDRIFVQHSWSQVDGLKSTKTGTSRTIPLMPETRKLLLELADDKDNLSRLLDNPFIFYSSDPQKPISQRSINRSFNEALELIGINEKERQERNIVFHSWRHYVATYLANNVKKRTGMGITGHKDERTYAGYSSHETDDEFNEKMAALRGLAEYKPIKREENIEFG